MKKQLLLMQSQVHQGQPHYRPLCSAAICDDLNLTSSSERPPIESDLTQQQQQQPRDPEQNRLMRNQ